MENQLKLFKIFKYSFKLKIRGGYILPLVLLQLMLSSCGIDSPVFLNPPDYLSNLSFYHAYKNDPGNALGYEFLYRIYDDSSIDSNTIITDAQSYLNEIKLLGLLSNNRSIFEDSYYRRMYPIYDNIGTSFNDPAIPPIMLIDDDYFNISDSSRRFEIHLDLNLGTKDYVELTTINYDPNIIADDPDPMTDYSTIIRFKRYVTLDGNSFETVKFSTINQNQDDVSNSIESPITIALFVVLYGLTDQFVSIFSDVVYIGSEIYTY